MCRDCQKERDNRYVFSAAENDATKGAAVTKSGKAFHARVVATGKERSPKILLQNKEFFDARIWIKVTPNNVAEKQTNQKTNQGKNKILIRWDKGQEAQLLLR